MHTWIKKLKSEKSSGNGQAAGEPTLATLIEENRRLHKELTVAREEREILKKAAAYFAQHQK
jgi:transposase